MCSTQQGKSLYGQRGAMLRRGVPLEFQFGGGENGATKESRLRLDLNHHLSVGMEASLQVVGSAQALGGEGEGSSGVQNHAQAAGFCQRTHLCQRRGRGATQVHVVARPISCSHARGRLPQQRGCGEGCELCGVVDLHVRVVAADGNEAAAFPSALHAARTLCGLPAGQPLCAVDDDIKRVGDKLGRLRPGLFGVVNHTVRAQRGQQLCLRRGGGGGNKAGVRLVLKQLEQSGAHPPTTAQHQHALSGPDLRLAERVQGMQRAVGQGRGLRWGQARWFGCCELHVQERVLGHAAERGPRPSSDNAVAHREASTCAIACRVDRLHYAAHITRRDVWEAAEVRGAAEHIDVPLVGAPVARAGGAGQDSH
mmetsp:Transcript_38005/g.98630  ORF Transcript_38005/g.98630 Transcript_38005/m.98630 type:complete len:367 (-) Transcript_38005:552-1652(-)